MPVINTYISKQDTWSFLSTAYFNQIRVNGLSGNDGALYINDVNILSMISGITAGQVTVDYLTSIGVVLTGDLIKYDQVCTIVQLNSSIWNNTYTTVNQNSAEWSLSGTAVDLGEIPTLSANWNSVYTSYNSTSALYLTSVDQTNYLTISTAASTYQPIGNYLTSVDLSSYTPLSTYTSTSGVYTTVQSNSADWNYQGTDIKNLSANWENTYTTVLNNSAEWLLSGVDVDLSGYTPLSTYASTSSVFTTVQTNSAYWNDAYTNLVSNSATYLLSGTEVDLGEIPSLSANWNSVYSSYNSVSGLYLTAVDLTDYAKISGLSVYTPLSTYQGTSGVYTTVQDNSGNWNSVYTTYNQNSALYLTGVEIDLSSYTPLSTYQGTSGVYTTVQENSGNWVEAYTNLLNNSAIYLLSGTEVDLGEIPTLSGNWNSVYNSFNSLSSTYLTAVDLTNYTLLSTYASTSGVYTTTQTNSGKWDSVYTSFNQSSSLYLTGVDLSPYAKLDATNQPFTSSIKVSSVDPEFRLLDIGNNEYSRWTKSDTNNQATFYNRAIKIGGNGNAYQSTSRSTSKIIIPDYTLGTSGTFAGWFKASELTGVTGNFLWNAYQDANNYVRVYYDGYGKLRAYAYIGGAWQFQITSSTTVSINNWYFVVLTWEDNNVKFYTNNVEKGSDISSSLTLTTVDNTLAGDRGNNYGWIGQMDEVMIWNRVLSTSELTQLYASGTGVMGSIGSSPWNSGLEFGYHLDETTGTNASDYSGNLRDGTVSGTGTSWVVGLVPVGNTNHEYQLIKSIDGVNANEGATNTFGDGDVTRNALTQIDGYRGVNLQIGGATKAALTTTLALSVPEIITGSSDAVQLKVIANATQTNKVFQTLASDAVTEKSSIDSLGNLSIGNITLTNGTTFTGATTATNLALTLTINGSAFKLPLYL